MKANFLLVLPSCASRASLTANSRSALCIPFCANFRDFMHLDACKNVNCQMKGFKLGLVMELQELLS